jgi:hypothetical protein
MSEARGVVGLMRRSAVVAGLIAVLAGCSSDSESAPADAGIVADLAEPEVTDAADDASVAEDAQVPEDTTAAADLGPELPPGPVDGTACDDANACTEGDVWTAGVCAGTAKSCDDTLTCTTDSCVEGVCANTLQADFCLLVADATTITECVADGAYAKTKPCSRCEATGGVPIFLDGDDGDPCDDGNVCTQGDLCVNGACVPLETTTCEDKGPCLSTVCDPTAGCNFPAQPGPCDDGNKCTSSDVCQSGVCGGDEVVCDDGDPCTDDKCTEKNGCVTTPSKLCDDGDPCTTDLCAVGGTCSHVENTGACDDGQPCTTGEVCTSHVCAGGTATDCDDDTNCTIDSCDPTEGCKHDFDETATCSDGFICTIDDKCVAGLCLGTKGACSYCPPPVTQKALKIIGLTFPSEGQPGVGLDVDADPTTCAPQNACSGGIDNAMGILAGVINDPVAQSITDGAMMYVVDLSQLTTDGEPFPFAVMDTKRSATSEAQNCNYMKEECGYIVSQFSFDPSCQPYFGASDARVNGTKFTAGGKGTVMTIAVALASQLIPITFVNARVEGYVTFDPLTKEVIALSGIIGGASPKQQLYDTINNLDPALLPVDKNLVLGFIDTILVNDIDLDGDGTKDAASAAMRFVTIPANLE